MSRNRRYGPLTKVDELKNTVLAVHPDIESLSPWIQDLPSESPARLREEWTLMLTEKIRRYVEADVMNPARESMPPQVIETYLRIIKQIGELDERSFKRLNSLDATDTNESPQKYNRALYLDRMKRCDPRMPLTTEEAEALTPEEFNAREKQRQTLLIRQLNWQKKRLTGT